MRSRSALYMAAASITLLTAATGCSDDGEQPLDPSTTGWIALTSETALPLRSEDQNNVITVDQSGESRLVSKGKPTYSPMMLRTKQGFIYPDGDGLTELSSQGQKVTHPIEGAQTLYLADSGPEESRDPVFVFNSPRLDSKRPNIIARVSRGAVQSIRQEGDIAAAASCDNGDVVWLSVTPLSDTDPTGPSTVRLVRWSGVGNPDEGTAVTQSHAPKKTSFIRCATQADRRGPTAVSVSGRGDTEESSLDVLTVGMRGTEEARAIPASRDLTLTRAWSTFRGRAYWVTWGGQLNSFTLTGDPDYQTAPLPIRGKSPISATFDGGVVNIVTSDNNGSGDRNIVSVPLQNPSAPKSEVQLSNWKFQSRLAKLSRGGYSFVAITSVFAR